MRMWIQQNTVGKNIVFDECDFQDMNISSYEDVTTFPNAMIRFPLQLPGAQRTQGFSCTRKKGWSRRHWIEP